MRSSSAATARAASPRSCTSRGAARNGALTLDSPGGLVQARIDAGRDVSVDMGVPDFDPRSLPFEAPRRSGQLPPGGRPAARSHIGAVSMGNPHAVLTVASVEAAPVATLGPGSSAIRAFRKRVNAGFLEIVDARAGASARLRARRGRDPQLRHRRLRGGRDRATARAARGARCG